MNRGGGPQARFVRPKLASVDAVASALQRLRCRVTVWAAVIGVLIAFLFVSPGFAQGQQTPKIDKSFGAATIPVGGSTTLTFFITGANLGNSGVNFADTLPGGLVVATPNGLTVTGAGPSCNASNVTATAGTASISLANVSLTPNQTCTIGVDVTATSAGQKNNSVKVFSNEGPGNNATAHLTVSGAPPTPPAIEHRGAADGNYCRREGLGDSRRSQRDHQERCTASVSGSSRSAPITAFDLVTFEGSRSQLRSAIADCKVGLKLRHSQTLIVIGLS
jgi:hypothetical protein